MFANAHVFVAQQILSSKIDSLAIIGSFLPDVALMKLISWDDLHKEETLQEFTSFLRKTNPDYLPLSAGISCHIVLDNLSHSYYKNAVGYAYQYATPEFMNLVSQATLSDDPKITKIKTHSFIETAVDMLLLQQYPELRETMRNAVTKTNIKEISKLISGFFTLDKQQCHKAITDYFTLMTVYDLNKMGDYIALWNALNKLLFDKGINEVKTEEAITIAINLVKDSYQEYLNTAIEKGKTLAGNDLQSFP